MCSLTGEASDLLRELSRNSSFDEVVSCLRQHYASLDQVEIYRAPLKNRRRRPGEPLMDLMKDVRRLFLAAYPGPTNYMSGIAAKDAFITALSDRDLMVKVLEREPETLDEAFKVAERLELYGAVPDLPLAESKSKNVPKVRGTVDDNDKLIKNLIETQKGIQNQLTSLQEVMQSMQQQSLRESSPVATGGARPMKPRVICHHCQRPGHIRPKCPDLAPRLHTASETSETRGTGTYGNVQVPRVTLPANRVQSVESTLYLPIQIGKRNYKALLDSGSEVTLLPAKAAEGFEMLSSYRVLRAANGTEISVLGSMTVDLKVGNLRLSSVFVISDQIDEAILGMDWMNQHKCLLDCGSNILKIQDQSFELFKESPK